MGTQDYTQLNDGQLEADLHGGEVAPPEECLSSVLLPHGSCCRSVVLVIKPKLTSGPEGATHSYFGPLLSLSLNHITGGQCASIAARPGLQRAVLVIAIGQRHGDRCPSLLYYLVSQFEQL